MSDPTRPDSPFIALLNGPNLNLLGERQPLIYGRDSLADVVRLCTDTAARFGLEIQHLQSNHEGELIDAVQRWRKAAVGFVVNAASYTHTSLALRDALVTIEGPLMEVHISNVHKREQFRHHSYLSDVAEGIIAGCGIEGYRFAIERIATLTERTPTAA